MRGEARREDETTKRRTRSSDAYGSAAARRHASAIRHEAAPRRLYNSHRAPQWALLPSAPPGREERTGWQPCHPLHARRARQGGPQLPAPPMRATRAGQPGPCHHHTGWAAAHRPRASAHLQHPPPEARSLPRSPGRGGSCWPAMPRHPAAAPPACEHKRPRKPTRRNPRPQGGRHALQDAECLPALPAPSRECPGLSDTPRQRWSPPERRARKRPVWGLRDGSQDQKGGGDAPHPSRKCAPKQKPPAHEPPSPRHASWIAQPGCATSRMLGLCPPVQASPQDGPDACQKGSGGQHLGHAHRHGLDFAPRCGTSPEHGRRAAWPARSGAYRCHRG